MEGREVKGDLVSIWVDREVKEDLELTLVEELALVLILVEESVVVAVVRLVVLDGEVTGTGIIRNDF